MDSYDVVALKRDFSEYKLIKGQKGTISDVCDPKNVEVEFCDSNGITIHLGLFCMDDLEVVYSDKTKNVYEISSIIDININGITYTDANGKVQCIDFHECRSNWVKHVNTSKKYISWDGEPYMNINESDTTCVGQRNWFSNKPYFEFYTHKFIRFEISPKKRIWDIFKKHWTSRYYKEFYDIQKKIEEAGWCTFDLG